jgi:hypothetical protein
MTAAGGLLVLCSGHHPGARLNAEPTHRRNAMPVLETKLNARSADFQANAAAMRTLVEDLNAKVTQV